MKREEILDTAKKTIKEPRITGLRTKTLRE